MSSAVNWKPEGLDVDAFAKQGGVVEGDAPAASLARWAESQFDAGSASVVHWRLEGELRERLGAAPQVWLHLQAGGQAHLRCQRCLQAVAVEIAVDRAFRFVRDEAQALAEDPDSEEDLLVLSRRFDARELIEDELLLELPLVPMHDACEPPASMTDDSVPEEAPEEDRKNPFAALEALKQKK